MYSLVFTANDAYLLPICVYGTLRPPNNESYSEEWGEQVLKKGDEEEISFRDYCVLNSCTDDGLDSIAVYNKFRDERDKKKNPFMVMYPWHINDSCH